MTEKLKPIKPEEYFEEIPEISYPTRQPLLRNRNERLALIFVALGILTIAFGGFWISEVFAPTPQPVEWHYTDIFGIPIATPIPTICLMIVSLAFLIHGPALIKR